METRLGAGRPVFKFPAATMIGLFLFATGSRPAQEHTQPPIKWVPGALTPGVKRPGRETDHSSPSRAEVKNV
jgi:hypothetical protein